MRVDCTVEGSEDDEVVEENEVVVEDDAVADDDAFQRRSFSAAASRTVLIRAFNLAGVAGLATKTLAPADSDRVSSSCWLLAVMAIM